MRELKPHTDVYLRSIVAQLLIVGEWWENQRPSWRQLQVGTAVEEPEGSSRDGIAPLRRYRQPSDIIMICTCFPQSSLQPAVLESDL